ncbi:S-adenosyl-L-methionine-dependent methyltransferase [Pavlovales sp. CCMP2436]|nr:S-adenosyl-L-methionine-dependent methyltransferase [Pavlovales sp. CCMP2436]|mmetsp:Transcript_32113/g.80035  ORF Transcript_32113/g.80035 Transcript_32113/m.80035 type:complete len:201 (+) Transcript_32113:363-965(+)
MLARARQVGASPEVTCNLSFVEADAGALSFEAASFAGVTSSSGILHMPDPSAFIAEAARVLRPSGRLAFSVWCPPPATQGYEIMPKSLAVAGSTTALPEGPPMFHYADCANVREALESAGFTDVRSDIVELVWELGHAAEFWTAIRDGTARTRAVLSTLSDGQAVQSHVLAMCAELARPDGSLSLRMPAVVSSGTRAPLH